MLLEKLTQNRDQITTIAKRHRAKSIKVFGSVVSGKSTEESDIDFLVEFELGSTLFDTIRLKRELQALLNRQVDIVSAKSLHWYLRDQILREAIPL